MAETLLSVGIDIGTSTTQLVISRLTLENRATPFSVPRVAINRREVLYRSAIHFTPLLSDAVIDAQGVRAIVEEEYRKSGFDKGEIAGRMIQTLARKKGISLEDGVWEDYRTIKERQYDKLADTLREYLRMEEIYGMLREARIS